MLMTLHLDCWTSIQDIYVRDCVVIKSDSGNEEKPYVAKIGSIWQEPGN